MTTYLKRSNLRAAAIAGSKVVEVEDYTSWANGELVTVFNDMSEPHHSSVSGTPASFRVVLADAIPAAWTGDRAASATTGQLASRQGNFAPTADEDVPLRVPTYASLTALVDTGIPGLGQIALELYWYPGTGYQPVKIADAIVV